MEEARQRQLAVEHLGNCAQPISPRQSAHVNQHGRAGTVCWVVGSYVSVVSSCLSVVSSRPLTGSSDAARAQQARSDDAERLYMALDEESEIRRITEAAAQTEAIDKDRAQQQLAVALAQVYACVEGGRGGTWC